MEDDAGFDFDDGYFEGSKTAVKKDHDDIYEPKIEFSAWFLHENDGKASNFLESERMRAAYYYMRHDFENALSSYQKLLAGKSGSRSEILESYARCLMACDRYEESEKIATEFFSMAQNFDHQLQALNLFSDLFWKSGKDVYCVVSTAACATLIEGNGDFWMRLGECFLKLSCAQYLEKRQCEQARKSDCAKMPLICAERFWNFAQGKNVSENILGLWAKKCLLTAKNLYFNCYKTSVGHARVLNDRKRRRIEEFLKLHCSNFEEDSEIRMCDVDSKSDQDGNENENESENMFCNDQKMIEKDLNSVFEIFVEKWLD